MIGRLTKNISLFGFKGDYEMKISEKALFRVWREIIYSDLQKSSKFKTGYPNLNVDEFIPDASTKSLTRVITSLIRSYGVVKTSRATGIPRSSLYSVMDENSNPTLNTVSSILKCLGYQLAIIPIAESNIRKQSMLK